MKKTNKLFAFLLAAIMVLSSLSMLAAADETETTAYICFSDASWGVQYWGEAAQYGDNKDLTGWSAVNATVTGYGTYTVSVDVTNLADAEGNALPGSDLAFMDVEIKDGETLFPNCFMTIDSVKVNGAEVELQSKTYTSSDDKINTRTNLFNEWVPDATSVENARTADGSNEGITACPVAKTIGEIKTIEVTFTLGDGVLCNASGDADAGELSEEEYDAFIAMGANMTGEWDAQYYGADVEGVTAVNGKLKSGETTTLSLTFPETITYTWFVAPCMIIDDPTTVSPSSTFDVKVYLDGVEVAVDLAAGDACWAEDTGDYLGNCVRIAGGYNEWGTKYIAEAPAGFKTITFEITPEIYIAEPADPFEGVPEFDPDGTYHAYIGLQTPKYSFRNAWDEATYGKETDYFNQITAWDADNNAYSLGGTFTDVEVNANGTYTVSVKDFGDWSADFADQDYFNLLFISTDIPNRPEVVISDVKVVMDGKEITTIAEPLLDPDTKEYQKVLITNIWNTDLEALPYYAVPTKSVELVFTISGFTNDQAADTPDTPDEPSTETEPTKAPEATAPTEAPAADDKKEDDKGGFPGWAYGVIAGVVAVAGGAGVAVSKKKNGRQCSPTGQEAAF